MVLQDENGPVNFYFLPFLKPGYVRQVFPENQPNGYESAVKAVLERETIDTGERNVLLSHQFYTAGNKDPETCESEQAVIMAGGLDRIEADVLSAFDYVALGHLHGSQKVGRASVRYCGTPYKYSVSEENHKKSITMVNLGEKGEEPELEFLPLHGIQDVRRERGSLSEILKRATEENRMILSALPLPMKRILTVSESVWKRFSIICWSFGWTMSGPGKKTDGRRRDGAGP